MKGSPTTEAEIKKIWWKNTLEVWNKEWENNIIIKETQVRNEYFTLLIQQKSSR